MQDNSTRYTLTVGSQIAYPDCGGDAMHASRGLMHHPETDKDSAVVFIGSRNEDGKSNSQLFCKRLDLVNE